MLMSEGFLKDVTKLPIARFLIERSSVTAEKIYVVIYYFDLQQHTNDFICKCDF